MDWFVFWITLGIYVVAIGLLALLTKLVIYLIDKYGTKAIYIVFAVVLLSIVIILSAERAMQ